MNSGKLLLTFGISLCALLCGSAQRHSPVYRPLVEEYTGLWCGWCPSGYVVLEAMNERDPERFVGVSYHYDDRMAAITDFPNRPGGYPAIFVDRERQVGSAEVYTRWDSLVNRTALGDITVSVKWKDEACKALTATTKVWMTDDWTDADLRISYMLTADGLSDSSWRQRNAFSGLTETDLKDYPEMQNEWGDIFVGGPEWVDGLVFNDVIIGTTIAKGIPKSLPPEIKAREEMTHVYDFKMTSVRDQDLLQHPELLRIVAVLIDARTGKVVNCAKSGYSGVWTGGIDNMVAEEEPEKVEWYDIQGLPVRCHSDGVVIRVETFPSGRKRFVKELGK